MANKTANVNARVEAAVKKEAVGSYYRRDLCQK